MKVPPEAEEFGLHGVAGLVVGRRVPVDRATAAHVVAAAVPTSTALAVTVEIGVETWRLVLQFTREDLEFLSTSAGVHAYVEVTLANIVEWRLTDLSVVVRHADRIA
jgi:hypothetical protein